MKKYIVLAMLLWSLTPLLAQQTPGFNQYYRNPFLINPAAAGIKPHAELMMLYRQQWLDIAGAPTTQALTFTSPIQNQRMGVGLYVYNDVANIVGRTGALAAYRYTVPFAQSHQLSFGLAAGLADNRIYFDRVRAEDPYESSIMSNMESGAYLDGSFGLQYQFRKLHVGLSAMQLFGNSLHYENSADERLLLYNLIRHYNITASYSFRMSENLSLDPYVLMKSAQGLPAQVDVNAIVKYKEDSWVGLSYRGNSAAAVSIGTDFDDRFTFGYAYEVPVNSFAGASGSTHEFMVGIRFGKGSANKDAKVVGDNDADKLQREIQGQYERTDQLLQENEKLQEKVEKNNVIITKQHDEIEELKKALKQQKEEVDKAVEGVKVTEQPSEEIAGDTYYAVVAAFKTLKYAKLYQKILQRELQLETSVVQSQRISGNDYFFIYTNSYAEFQQAQEEINRINKQDSKGLILGGPWIYLKNSK